MVNFIKRDNDDIFSRPIIGFFFKNQKFLMTLKIVVLALFLYAIYFGYTHTGRDNLFTSALFWGIFWSLFIVVTLPTLGRIFCGICPHGFIGKYITKFGLKKTMPKWMQNPFIGLILLVIGWWGVSYMFPNLYRTPMGTAILFTVMTFLAVVIFFIYKEMSYCKYICPIGTLTRAYGKLSFTWLGTYRSACNDCTTFDCSKACQYNLKPFTFDKRNSMSDCTLCMDCTAACEAVSFKVKKPSFSLFKKFQIQKAEVWAFVLILASIPITMSFHHGIGRSNAAGDMIWSKTAEFLKAHISFGAIDPIGLFAFLYAIVFTVLAAVIGMFIASVILQKDYKKIFYDLGYSYAPLFILGSIAHSLETFFTRGYEHIVEGFAQGFGFSVDVAALASRGDSWLHLFGLLKWVAVIWAVIILYKRMKLLDATKMRKILAYPFAASLIIFFVGVNMYRGYILDTYGRASNEHAKHTQKFQRDTQAAPSKTVQPGDRIYFTDKKPTANKSRGGMPSGMMMGMRKRGEVPTKKVWLVTDDINSPKCVENAEGTFYTTDINNSLVTPKIEKRGCLHVSFEIAYNGFYNVYYVQELGQYTSVAKYEYKRYNHSAETYDKERMSAKTINEVPFDILRLRSEDESFHSQPRNGDQIRFKILKAGEALAGATVVLETQFGWQKSVTTDKNGIATFELIKDYNPKWGSFDKRFKEKFIVTADYADNNHSYKATYSGVYMPASAEYQSYAYGLFISLALLILLSASVFWYRYRVQKPFKEVTFDD
jgi:hypothetical protein